MAKILAANVTVTPVPRHGRRLVEGVKQVYADITFGNGALEYSTGGIPLPAIGVFGLNEIFFADVEQKDGYKYVIDRANHKLMIYQAPAVTASGSLSSVSGGTPAGTNTAPAFTGTEANLTGDAQAYTPVGAVAAPVFSGAALAGHTHTLTGAASTAAPMTECPATYAPAAITLRLRLEGN